MNPLPQDGARETLRQATKKAHRALDHHPLLRRLLSPELTIEQYADALQALFDPHAVLEQRIHGSRWSAASHVLLPPRHPLLAADLKALGRHPPPLPAAAPPADESEAAWLGRVYVLEGSRLGSAVIARQVRARLGLQVPLRFFEAGISTAQWEALCVLMDRRLTGSEALGQAASSARAAFDDYRLGLESTDAVGTALDNALG